MGLADCFESYGVKPRNPRWSWSARSSDGSLVVLTLWLDEFSDAGRVYVASKEERGDGWLKRPGNKERLENLRWARDHCDGRFSVVITKAKDTLASPRAIAECYPQPRLRMRIVELNDETGEFRAERED